MQTRLTNVMRHRPTLMIDRANPILDLLRRYQTDASTPVENTPLQQYLIELRAEVEALEAWAESRHPLPSRHLEQLGRRKCAERRQRWSANRRREAHAILFGLGARRRRGR